MKMLVEVVVGLLTIWTLLGGAICDIQDLLSSKNLNNQNAFLNSEFWANNEATLRVVRAVSPTLPVWISKTILNLPEDVKQTVTCSGNSNDLTWLDPSHKKISKSTSSLIIKENKRLNQTTLEFSPVKLKHKGMYTCVNTKFNRSANFTLTVLSKPRVKISYDSNKFDVGDDFTIACIGNSANLTWTNAFNSPIPPHPFGPNPVFAVPENNLKSNKLILVFRNASMTQAGDYKCYLNVAGQEKHDGVSIKIKPASLEFSKDEDEKTVKENEEFSIKCKGKVDRIWWSYDYGKTIDQSHREDENIYVKGVKRDGRKLEQELNIENVEKSNEGKYVCSGISSFDGRLMQRKFKLKVKEDDLLTNPIIRSRISPIFGKVAKVELNNKFTAACIGQTENIEWLGPPHYWKISENPPAFPTSSSIFTQRIPLFKKKLLLKFQNVTLADEGKYICRVSKRDMMVESEFNLTVIIPASFNDTPSQYGTNETNDVKLECVVNGRPKPIVTWYTNGKAIVNDSKISYTGDSLIIRNTSYKDAGKYICVARQPTNDGYTKEKAVNLEIFHKPYFSERNVTIEKVKNTTSTIECNCITNPAARYSWSKDNVTIVSWQSSNVIQISILNNTDFDVLVCNATNSYGSSLQTINVTAMRTPLTPEVNIIATDKDHANFTIKASQNATISYFNIEFREKSDPEWNVKNETKGDSWSHVYVLEDLKSNTDFLIRVRSVNPVGVSEFTKEASFKTSFARRLTASIGILFTVIIFSLYNNFLCL